MLTDNIKKLKFNIYNKMYTIWFQFVYIFLYCNGGYIVIVIEKTTLGIDKFEV